MTHVALWLKAPLQNENTMLLSAHKNANLKYCQPIVLKTWSDSLVTARLYWSSELYYYYYF